MRRWIVGLVVGLVGLVGSPGMAVAAPASDSVPSAGPVWQAGIEAVGPPPYNQKAGLGSVSCASPGECSAVGTYSDSAGDNQGLLVGESGGSWGTATELTLPANAASNPHVSLGSVSCASAGDCSAVGSYLDSAGANQGLLVAESGGSWGTAIELTLPANAASSPHVSVGSVSCASAGECSAVGTYSDSAGGTQGLLVGESGGSWGTATELTLPANAASNPGVGLGSVSCASAGECSAVGGYFDSAGDIQGLSVGESGGSWGTATELTPPADAASSPHVSVGSVSCASAGECSAVGSYVDSAGAFQGLLVSESGGSWGTAIKVTLPADAASQPSVGLGSVSCASAGECSAVGGYSDSAGNLHGLLVGDSGGSWGTAIKVTLPANAASNPRVSLGSVSCASAGECSAVGSYRDSAGAFHGLLVDESGGSWGTAIELTLPANAASNPGVGLGSVSCASAGECSAVGSYSSSGGQRGLAVGESGGSWGTATVTDAPANAGAPSGGVVNSVSCASAGDCSAVGSYHDGEGAPQGLLVGESGGSWRNPTELTLPANAASNQNAGLESVSCASAGECSAVGTYLDSASDNQGLLVGESGGSWGIAIKVTPPANAASNPGVILESVSCASPVDCDAVGVYADSALHVHGLLVGESGGSWGTATELTLPANAASNPQVTLGSVSCASPGDCSAVGSYTDSAGATQGLLVSESGGAGAPQPSSRCRPTRPATRK